LTGKFNRSEILIASVEVEVDAAGYEGKALWIESYRLMFPNGKTVDPDTLEQMCRRETDVRAIADILGQHYLASEWSAEQYRRKHVLTVADIFVQAAHERNEPPADLVERVRKANLLENVMCGVSLYAILKALDERWEPWDETLASVQCPPQAVDSFAEASIDAAMAAAAEDTSEG
jgi:hypothetical protein